MEDNALLQSAKYSNVKVIVETGETAVKVYKNAHTTGRKLAVGWIASSVMGKKGDLLVVIKYNDIVDCKVLFPKKSEGLLFIKRADGNEFSLSRMIDYRAKQMYDIIQKNVEAPVEESSTESNIHVQPKPEEQPSKEDSKWVCSACGASNLESNAFCTKCGTQRTSKKSIPIAKEPGSSYLHDYAEKRKAFAAHAKTLLPGSDEDFYKLYDQWDNIVSESKLHGKQSAISLTKSYIDSWIEEKATGGMFGGTLLGLLVGDVITQIEHDELIDYISQETIRNTIPGLRKTPQPVPEEASVEEPFKAQKEDATTIDVTPMIEVHPKQEPVVKDRCEEIEKPDYLFCRHCGRKIPADSKFCTWCGEKIVYIEE